VRRVVVPWSYDPGDKRRKHKWNKEYAGFEIEGGLQIGKCPQALTTEVAEQLLNSGVEWYNPLMRVEYPWNIYNVHDGVIYKAAITLHGISYHGFPYMGRVPKEVVEKLRAVAVNKGCSKEFEAWLKQHITQ
jgi:hypothetical protein